MGGGLDEVGKGWMPLDIVHWETARELLDASRSRMVGIAALRSLLDIVRWETARKIAEVSDEVGMVGCGWMGFVGKLVFGWVLSLQWLYGLPAVYELCPAN